MSNIGSGTRKAETYGYGYVNSYGWSVPVGVGAGIAITAEQNQATKGLQFSEWKQIEDGLVQVRRAMTEKYKIQF